MKLNPDCIRDCLLSVEELSTYDSVLTSEQISQSKYLSKYSKDEIYYHLNQLILGNYIVSSDSNKWIMSNLFIINDLSPLGHEFLSNIRKDDSWNKVKSIGKEIGTETLSSIKTIAENIVSCAITKYFGL